MKEFPSSLLLCCSVFFNTWAQIAMLLSTCCTCKSNGLNGSPIHSSSCVSFEKCTWRDKAWCGISRHDEAAFSLLTLAMEAKNLILIIEDESSISDSISYALRTEGFTPLCCKTGEEALKLLSSLAPLLVVLDIGLPDLSGFEVCKQIRKTSSVPVLFLTARAEEIDRVLGFELGGDDYMSKPFSPRELVARIKAILRRSRPVISSEGQARPTKFHIDQERLQITFQGTPLPLSRYEFRLLCILVRRAGRVYSREELMALAWETPEMSLERTIDAHIKTIRAKLRAIDPNNDSIITHRGSGYSLREER